MISGINRQAWGDSSVIQFLPCMQQTHTLNVHIKKLWTVYHTRARRWSSPIHSELRIEMPPTPLSQLTALLSLSLSHTPILHLACTFLPHNDQPTAATPSAKGLNSSTHKCPMVYHLGFSLPTSPWCSSCLLGTLSASSLGKMVWDENSGWKDMHMGLFWTLSQ